MKRGKAGLTGAAAAAAFLTFAVFAWGADTVKFGYSGPLSGGAAKYGKNCEAGLIMAMEELNGKGGITVSGKKYKIEVTSLDDRYRPDLTVQNVRHNGIKINSDSNVQQVTLYNCVFHNIWQRGVKGVKVVGAAPVDASQGLPHPILSFLQRSPKALRGRPGRHAAELRRQLRGRH